jgi:hypothetical protein
MKLPPEWSEVIALLCSHRVRFVVVGAHALAVLGRPRATGDLDVLVDPTAANARRLGAVLREFGFPARAPGPALCRARPQATLGREPLRVDLMTSITGVPFARAWRRRTKVPFGNHTVGFLSRADFVANKRAAARPKDLLDLALLAESRPRRRRRPRRRACRPGRVSPLRRARPPGL